MKTPLTVLITLLAAALVGLLIVHSGGLLNFAGDEPHPSAIEGFIAFARERFIKDRSTGLEVPDLSKPEMIAEGGAHYVPMCSGCHLGPGTQDTEIRRGLYPQPPNLAQPEQHAGHHHDDGNASAARQFWIIKHGVKMTAMPAWGATHDDSEIWALVAFLQQLPEMPPEQYLALQAGAAEGHQHGHDKKDAEGGHDGAGGHVDEPGKPAREQNAPTKEPSKETGEPEAHEHSH